MGELFHRAVMRGKEFSAGGKLFFSKIITPGTLSKGVKFRWD